MSSTQVDMSAHFTTKQLLHYALPSIGMVLCTSVYGIVDGLFVSNFAGTTAFAAVNFILPIIMLLSSVGFMTGTGASALISIMRGKGEDERANQTFSLIVYFTAAVGLIMAILGVVTCSTVCQLMGAEGQMLEDCTIYGQLVYLSLPGFVLQCAFQSLMMAAGKPKLGLWITVASGVANIVLDFVLVGLMGMGIIGAALATNVSEWLGGLAPIVYFARKNSSFLRLGKTKIDGKIIAKTCTNGSSEMMTNIAVSLVSVLFNVQLLSLIGENGVAAYGVIMYVYLIFEAIFIGYCMATGPLMSYQYGAKNSSEMNSLLRKSLGIIAVSGLLMLTAAQLMAYPAAFAFCGYDAELCSYTEYAFRCFYLCFIVAGFNVYGSALFTSLGNGLLSAGISFVRTLFFECGCIIVFPMIFGPESLWFTCLAAEIFAFIIVVICMKAFAKTYGYGKQA